MFSYGRDRLIPFSGWLSTYNHKTRTPLNAVWGVTFVCIILGLPILGSSVAFESLLSLSTIALFLLYAGPGTIRITYGRKLFVPGPFSLGWWAYPIGILSTIWMVFATIVFCLPTELPGEICYGHGEPSGLIVDAGSCCYRGKEVAMKCKQ